MYPRYFQKFLDHTDEKEVFVREISTEIKDAQAREMLDIGAGNGQLSIPLASLVSRYVAIERNDEHAAKLRAAGLEVIQSVFPCEVPGSFDFVLASHVLSYRSQQDQRGFLHRAWNTVTKGGTFLVVTYRSEEEDDWTRLMQRLGENRQDTHAAGFRNTLETLAGLGEVHVRKVETHVRTDQLDDMLQALAFVASDGIPAIADEFLAKRKELQAIFDAEYRIGEEYVFPFQHFFVRARK